MESCRPGTSLYIHVPFCAGKCRYCDFFSVPYEGAGETAARVIEETEAQARAFLEVMGMTAAETAYIGGGTPSVIPYAGLDRLLELAGRLHPGELTVEANPESLDAGFLNACARRGVTRLSVGMQSGRDACLRLLGRPGNAEDNAEAFALLSSWKGDLNVDYISGIPGQDESDLLRDLAPLGRKGVGHVSLYSLTVEEGTPLERMVKSGAVRKNPEEEGLWFEGRRILEQNGFRQYEISNFALRGKECLHNLRYWRLEPYLGVGPGAVSTLPAASILPLLGEKGGRIDETVLRLTTPRSIPSFLSGRSGLWGMEIEPIRDRDFLLETLIMGLRTVEGIERTRFEGRFGRSFEELFPGLWGKWAGEGAAAGGSALALTDRGRLFLNRHLAEIKALIDREDLPSLGVQWP